MPTKERSSEIGVQAEAEKRPDFAELQKQKEALFREIEADSLKLDENGKFLVVSRILGHSVKDGFEMARKLGCDLLLPLASEDFLDKHKTFASAFSKFTDDAVSYVSTDNNLKRYRVGVLRARLNGSQEPLRVDTRTSTPYLNEIDGYYTNFIRERRLDNLDTAKDDRTQAERTAEEHLASVAAVLEESYYTGPIRRLIDAEDEEGLERLRPLLEYHYGEGPHVEEDIARLRGDVIDRATVDDVLRAARFQSNDLKMQRVLREARYAPSKVVFETRKKASEELLLQQIKDSLIKRGYKDEEFTVRFDKATEQYVVDDARARTREKKEEGKENLRKVKEIANSKVLSPDDPKYKDFVRASSNFPLESATIYSHVSVIDGEVYNIWSNTGHTGFIEFPNDHLGETLRAVQSITKTRKGLVYGVNDARRTGDGYNNFQLYLNDKRLNSDDLWQDSQQGVVETTDGSIYWIGNNIPRKGTAKFESQGTGVFKDGQLIRTYDKDARLSRLAVIEDEIVYTVDTWEEPKRIKLVVGNNEFGPYDEIKLCENSKDKLVFYAKKGDEHFIYVDEEEKVMQFDGDERPRFGGVESVLKTDDDVVVHWLYNSAMGATPMIYSVRNRRSSYIARALSYDASNVSVIDGKLFYIEEASSHPDKQKWLHWGISPELELDSHSKNNQVVDFRDGIFITDGPKILSLKYGEKEFKEMQFEGTVELVKSGERLFIIETLKDKKRIWEYTDKLELQEREQRDLDLANAVANEELGPIEEYFKKYYPDEEKMFLKDKIKRAIEQSKSFLRTVNQTIKEAPQLFLDTLRAKDDKPTEALMSQMFYYMFPEAQARREQALRERRENRGNPWSVFGGSGGAGGGGGRGEIYDYDAGHHDFASMSESDYYEAVRSKREVLKLREPLPDGTFVQSSIFGAWNGSGWSKVNVPISEEVADPAKETTFEFVDEKASQTINLPRIANAKIIQDRIKGITAKGGEVGVEILEANSLGEVRVKKSRETKRVAYSQNYSELPKTMTEVTEKDYEKFRKGFEKSFGDVMTKEIGDVGDELDIFIRGLAGKSPREKVIAIQEFCYEYGYYDFDEEARDADSFEERLAIMELRMDAMKGEKPELAGKKYAGICTDFASLSAALLRRAGFVSGIASGFVPEAGSTSVTTDRAHAVSFVLWPNPDTKGGKPELIIVDATPSSITPRIAELEAKAADIQKELSVDAEKEMEKLEKVLATMKPEDIKKLANGELERTLNHILYGVKQSHVAVMERILNASRYAGFDIVEMTHGNIADEIEFRKFLEEETRKERNAEHENRGRRGEELFKLMLEFSERLRKDKGVSGKDDALDVLEKVFDTASGSLEPIESRSAAAIITYLRARRMQ